MLEYRQSVREYIVAARKLMKLRDLSLEEVEALRDASERLSVLIVPADENSFFMPLSS